MKKALLILSFALTSSLQAQTIFTYTGKGNWTDAEKWSPSYPGTTIEANQEAVISPGSNVLVTYFTNKGKITNRGTFSSNSFFYNYGTIQNDSLFFNLSFLYNYGNIKNDSVFNNNSFFYNYGDVQNDRLFNSNSIFYNYGNLTNNRMFYANSIFENNSNLTDNGRIYHHSNFHGNNISHRHDFHLISRFSAGLSTQLATGHYLFNDNLYVDDNGYILCEIRSDMQYDTIEVLGQTTLAGCTLEVNILDGYEPAIGTTFTILTSNAITGTFHGTLLPTLSNNKAFKVIYTPTAIMLKVVDASTLDVTDISLERNSLVLYPNPAKEHVYVKGLERQEFVTISNATGTTIKSISVDLRSNCINIDDLPKGLYLFSIGNAHATFIKE